MQRAGQGKRSEAGHVQDLGRPMSATTPAQATLVRRVFAPHATNGPQALPNRRFRTRPHCPVQQRSSPRTSESSSVHNRVVPLLAPRIGPQAVGRDDQRVMKRWLLRLRRGAVGAES